MRQPPGLINTGNSCFRNAILQCLASTTFDRDADLPRELVDILQELRILHTTHRSLFIPESLRLISNTFIQRFLQQDAHEYFETLIDHIERKNMEHESRFGSQPFAARLINTTARDRVIRSQSRTLTRRSACLGLLGSRVTCGSCDYEGILTCQKTVSLNLRVAEADITEVLRAYFQTERLDSYRCPKCSILETLRRAPNLVPQMACLLAQSDLPTSVDGVPLCLINSDQAHRLLSFERLPRILVLHLMRSTHDVNGIPTKDGSHVTFGEFLSPSTLSGSAPSTRADLMNAFRFPSSSSLRHSFIYRLVATVNHYGNFNNGHYTCDRRVGQSWFRVSDQIVHHVSINDVLNCTNSVYMLFYEHCDIDSTLY